MQITQECRAYEMLTTPTSSWRWICSHRSVRVISASFLLFLSAVYILPVHVCLLGYNMVICKPAFVSEWEGGKDRAKSFMICSLFLSSNYSIEPSWSCTSDRELFCLRLSSEWMPEWIFLAMPFEHNKVKGMRGRTRSFQGRNNKARWMPLRLQNTASLFSKCVSL